jgi:predicted metal-binding protein
MQPTATAPFAQSAGATPSATLEGLVRRALELGAAKAKIIDTDSIIVQKWVKWKCVYGCPMYEKDGYHPPFTPDLDEVREVLSEYTRAILLNGTDGRLLTEAACRLEGEAYRGGFYKAFALSALSPRNETPAEPGAT